MVSFVLCIICVYNLYNEEIDFSQKSQTSFIMVITVTFVSCTSAFSIGICTFVSLACFHFLSSVYAMCNKLGFVFCCCLQ